MMDFCPLVDRPCVYWDGRNCTHPNPGVCPV